MSSYRVKPHIYFKIYEKIDCLSNAIIAYRVLVTIPITMTFTKKSFSKLKLLKSFLWSTMLQERLNGLTTITIKNDILEIILL